MGKWNACGRNLCLLWISRKSDRLGSLAWSPVVSTAWSNGAAQGLHTSVPLGKLSPAAVKEPSIYPQQNNMDRVEKQALPPLIKGDWASLSTKLQAYIMDCVAICRPDNIFICDGSDEENAALIQKMVAEGMTKKLGKYENCWLTRTDPADVARVERLTFISTRNKKDTVAQPKAGIKGILGNWMSPEEMQQALDTRFPGCMQGRTMYVIPYSMGPIGSPLAKIGIELTDSPYVVASMKTLLGDAEYLNCMGVSIDNYLVVGLARRQLFPGFPLDPECFFIMTRMGNQVLRALGNGDFVKCLHSVGLPLPASRPIINGWPCNPEKVIIAHRPEQNEICSYGSGYGGNSLLGKKCLALRLGSIIAKREGWLAEHMLILGITNPEGKKIYVTAAFPSACGKTNLAMLIPTLPGFKVECVGDDIAWLKFDKNGVLRAINPEAGIFGVAPGTSSQSNPNALAAVTKNTVFTNVAETPDGGFWWEGLEQDIPVEGSELIDWTGQPWTLNCGRAAAHPNSRFCAPLGQCPVVDPQWEDPEGVPISAIIFGGRRPQGVPLVYEALNWQHGVFVGSAMRSEATAAAEYSGKVIMHDPMAMRPFFGYNFGDYLRHWLSLAEKNPGAKLPKIYHVNWFRKDQNSGKFLWPGFGENCRVLDWIVRRVNGEDCAVQSPVGYLPTPDALNVDGLGPVDMDELFRLPKDFWLEEVEAIKRFYEEQLPEDLPSEMQKQLDQLRDRVSQM